jgi:hypothetical protein
VKFNFPDLYLQMGVESVLITPAEANLASVLDALLAQISPKPDENDTVHWLPDKVRGFSVKSCY